MKTHCLPSYVYKHSNQYYVQQWEGEKLKTYGKFRTADEAIQHRNKLVKQGTIKPRLGIHKIKYYPNRYIIKTPPIHMQYIKSIMEKMNILVLTIPWKMPVKNGITGRVSDGIMTTWNKEKL